MKPHFTRGGNGREWQEGRFDLVDLVQPPASDVGTPRAYWGLAQPQAEGMSPDHTSAHLYWVPEGRVLTVRCHACGGRYEGLFDSRAIRRAPDPSAALRIVHAAVAGPLTEEWQPDHVHCAHEPKRHHMPVLVQDLLRVAEKTACEAIAAGEPVPGMLYLLDTTGRVFCVPIDDLESSPPRSIKRANKIAARHFAVREMIRVHKINLQAAVVAMEAWLANEPAPSLGDIPSPRNPNRTKVLSLMVATPNFARQGVGMIHRRGSIPNQGPGTVGAIEWRVEVGPSAMLDTLFATTDVLPQSM